MYSVKEIVKVPAIKLWEGIRGGGDMGMWGGGGRGELVGGGGLD